MQSVPARATRRGAVAGDHTEIVGLRCGERRASAALIAGRAAHGHDVPGEGQHVAPVSVRQE